MSSRTWSSRSSRSSRPSSSYSLVESNFRVTRPETPLIPEVRIHRKDRSRVREISINDSPMMLLPKARVRDSADIYDNVRRPYSVVADNSTQGLHISTIQSYDSMQPRTLPKSALKSRRMSISRSEADSGISSMRRSVTFENLCQSRSTVFKSDDEFDDNLSDMSDDEKQDSYPEDRLPLLNCETDTFPEHLDTFGGGEPVLFAVPRPPFRASTAKTKRRKHSHSDGSDATMCELCGTILSDREKVQRSFGKVDTFLDWVMSKWGKRQELQYIPRPAYVYRGHAPHFCNFVQQVQLHSKQGGATDSTGIPDSDIDEEVEFITESIEGRLINKWRKSSSGSPRSNTLSRIPKLDDYISDEAVTVPELSGTEGRPGSPSSLDEGETRSEDGAQRRPVTGVEVKVSSPVKSDQSVRSFTFGHDDKSEPKEDLVYKSDGLSIPELDENDHSDKTGGAWDNDSKSSRSVESLRIPINSEGNTSDVNRPPSPSRPPPSPEPIVLPSTTEPPKPSRKKGCAKKTKKPVERSRKMKEIETPKEPDPPKVEEPTEPELPILESEKAEVGKVDLQVPDLPSTVDSKEKSKKEKSKPKRHLIEAEDDPFRADPTDLLNDQMKLSRTEIDWSNMDINGMDEVKKTAPIKSWITGRLALSQQASRFELPMDMKLLEKMTPQQYVKKHCIISSRRHNLYQKIFMKNKDKSHSILYKDLDRTLKDVLVNTITSEQVQEVLNLLDINEETKVDSKLFAGLAAFAERVLYPKYVTEEYLKRLIELEMVLELLGTEDTQDMPEYQKEKIECADFCALDWKFHGVQVNPQMTKLLKMIS